MLKTEARNAAEFPDYGKLQEPPACGNCGSLVVYSVMTWFDLFLQCLYVRKMELFDINMQCWYVLFGYYSFIAFLTTFFDTFSP